MTRGTLAFDPSDGDYGPASRAVRELIATYAAIDWFVPPQTDVNASALFAEHVNLVRRALPSAFAPELVVTHHVGVARELDVLCQRAKAPSDWDWKFGVIKKLVRAHSVAHGWSMATHVAAHGADARPGSLFVAIGEHCFWNEITPRIDLGPRNDERAWYHSWTQLDLMECLEWQLAEASDDLSMNPVWPLLRCYAAGYYPFVLAPDAVGIFAFDAPRTS